jgi:hypothetical protein
MKHGALHLTGMIDFACSIQALPFPARPTPTAESGVGSACTAGRVINAIPGDREGTLGTGLLQMVGLAEQLALIKLDAKSVP